ncbi:hypothetical protein BVX98_07500 [bacterium F11]|nr:hypothetical protein BVX98_07500 [bacterium F11]
MLTFDLLNEVDRIQSEMNRLFSTARPTSSNSYPALNIWAGDNKLVATAELPGIDPNKLDIAVEGNVLTLRGERPEPELKDDESWVRQERGSGVFVRTFELPYRIEANKVDAKYSNGVLTLTLPRAEEDKPKKIPIKAA